MPKRKGSKEKSSKATRVTLNQRAGRPYAVRYVCPMTGDIVRLSTGTYDDHDAEQFRRDTESELRAGQDPRRTRIKGKKLGGQMQWEDFLQRYYEMRICNLRPKSIRSTMSDLEITTHILKPRALADVADSEALHELQSKLLAGAEGRHDPPRPRSPHTVKSHMATVMAALNWAVYMEWLESVPKLRKVKVGKLTQMKGRPVTPDEFKQMLEVTEAVVGPEAAESWEYVLRGLWESALRLEELMTVSWDDQNEIRPVWSDGHPVLAIPHDRQKNDREQSIPLLPGFESLLLETPDHERYSWVFNPASLQTTRGRKPSLQRPSADWVGKVISRIGKAAGIVVVEPKGRTPAKYASAHDLRRGCADYLVSKGLPETLVQVVLRHASLETTKRHYIGRDVQREASMIRERLKVGTN